MSTPKLVPKPKAWERLTAAIENGTHYGLRRAFKHRDACLPGEVEEAIIDAVTNAVLDAVLEEFEI